MGKLRKFKLESHETVAKVTMALGAVMDMTEAEIVSEVIPVESNSVLDEEEVEHLVFLVAILISFVGVNKDFYQYNFHLLESLKHPFERRALKYKIFLF